eukprot:3607812-Alexandrium_andersonii.AAC.1
MHTEDHDIDCFRTPDNKFQYCHMRDPSSCHQVVSTTLECLGSALPFQLCAQRTPPCQSASCRWVHQRRSVRLALAPGE